MLLEPNVPSQFDPRWINRFRRFARAAELITMAVGALDLLGWALGLPLLKFALAGQTTMKPLTALGLLLAGASLWLLPDPTDGQPAGPVWRRRLAQIAAGVVALVGAAVLPEYWLG